MADRKKAKRLAKERMKCNKPKRTPGHATKSHVVKACKDGEEKIIRFGQQGVKGAGKNPKTAKEKARKASYYARHNAQDSKPDKMSARYWSHKVKWWPPYRENACLSQLSDLFHSGLFIRYFVSGAGKNWA